MEQMKLNSESVAFEHFDDETVFVDLGTGSYYTVRGWVLNIIHLLDCHRDRQEINQLISKAPASDAARIQEVITEMTERGLIISTAEPAQPVQDFAANDELGESRINTFEDVQDIIKLDPIHEVSDAGWPFESAGNG